MFLFRIILKLQVYRNYHPLGGKMTTVAEKRLTSPKEISDILIASIHKDRPSLPGQLGEQFSDFIEKMGFDDSHLLCLSTIERQLVFLDSLSKYKWELSKEDYVSWDQAYSLWQKNEGRLYLNEKTDLYFVGRSIRSSSAPYHERIEFGRMYVKYLYSLEKDSGCRSNDPAPGKIIQKITGYHHLPHLGMAIMLWV